MLELKFIREHPVEVRAGILKKHQVEALPILEELLAKDDEHRALLSQLEKRRSEQKKQGREISRIKAGGGDAQEALRKAVGTAAAVHRLEEEVHPLSTRIDELLLLMPNLPHSSVPEGKDAADNVVVGSWGTPPQLAFPAQPHWILTERWGWVDYARGAKVSGSGFPFYMGIGARLVRGLVQFFLDHHRAHGFTEVRPPILINERSAVGAANLPDKEGQMYAVTDGYYLIPTAETSLTNLHQNEILSAEALPLMYAAHTPCFRREAGSYGKDVRGLNRLHQFDKVEMVVFEHSERSYQMLETLTRMAEELLELLNLPYRRLSMCGGDMGFAQTKKYDLEVFSVAQERWLEVSSISNFEAFQARRLNTRFREKGKPRLVHTLNGSGLAIPRVLAALIENNQLEDGRVALPEVLWPYLDQRVIGG